MARVPGRKVASVRATSQPARAIASTRQSQTAELEQRQLIQLRNRRKCSNGIRMSRDNVNKRSPSAAWQ